MDYCHCEIFFPWRIFSAPPAAGGWCRCSHCWDESRQGSQSQPTVLWRGRPTAQHFLNPSGISTSCPNTQTSLHQVYGHGFRHLEGQNIENAYAQRAYSTSAFQPLHIASKFNNRTSKSSARHVSCDSLNNLGFGFGTNNYSDNKRGLTNFRSKSSGENIFQSTLSYHLANKFSKRHFSQR